VLGRCHLTWSLRPRCLLGLLLRLEFGPSCKDALDQLPRLLHGPLHRARSRGHRFRLLLRHRRNWCMDMMRRSRWRSHPLRLRHGRRCIRLCWRRLHRRSRRYRGRCSPSRWLPQQGRSCSSSALRRWTRDSLPRRLSFHGRRDRRSQGTRAPPMVQLEVRVARRCPSLRPWDGFCRGILWCRGLHRHLPLHQRLLPPSRWDLHRARVLQHRSLPCSCLVPLALHLLFSQR
jgi:hypothetical protein